MRLHNSESPMPSVCRGLTNIHLNPNNAGNSQINNNKNVGTSIAISCADGTSSSSIGNSSSSSSLSTSAFMNGYAISVIDKSMVSPKNRHAADFRTFASKLAVKDESSSSSNSSESRAYARGNYCNAEQSTMIKLDSRNAPRCEQSSSILPGQQICADACGQDQSTLPNTDSSGPSQIDLSVSPHADIHSGSALRIEQPIVATLPDGRVVTRSEQSMNILLTEDLCGTRQPDHATSIRRLSVTNEDLCPTSSRQLEQSTTNILVSEDLRGMRQHADQSTSLARATEDLRISRAEQPINTQNTLDLRGVPRSQQNANISLNDSRVMISRPEQATMIPLAEGRSNPIAEHNSPAVQPDLRSGVPRILQNSAAALPGHSVAVPVAAQSAAQSGSSVLLTEEVSHSEEPLPPGWEMRYDLYGRR